MFGLASPSRSGELGYWAHPDARGHGLTTRAVRLATRHGLLPPEVGGLGMVRLVIRAAAQNEASQRVAQAAGFRPSGRDRCAERLRDGTLADLLRFELVEADLQASHDGARVAGEDGAHRATVRYHGGADANGDGDGDGRASSAGRHAMSGGTAQDGTPHLPGSQPW
jgi:hypothetical protein